MVANRAVGLIDVLGLRALNEKGTANVAALKAIKGKATDDPEFVKAIDAIIADYKKLIGSLPENGRTRRSVIIGNTLALWASETTSKTYLKSSGHGKWKGRNKCNKYVGNVTGFKTFAVSKWSLNTGYVQRYPIAGEWANPKLFARQYTAVWKVTPKSGCGDKTVTLGLKVGRKPILGDIVAIGEPTTVGGDAHVGIYLGDGYYVSATTGGDYNQVGLVIKPLPEVGEDYKQILYRSTGKCKVLTDGAINSGSE